MRFSAVWLGAIARGLVLAVSLGLAGVAGAQQQGETVETPHVAARLVASAQAIAPGDTITLGLAKQIIPGWHTYWRNPGDSGIATDIVWRLPEGATAGDIEWPAPERHALGPVTNYGYEDEVTLLAAFTAPADAQPGAVLQIGATASWLVCADICIPEEIDLALELPVAPRTVGDGHPSIDAARARLPQPAPWAARHAVDDEGVRLAVDIGSLPAQDADLWFYPFDWGRIDHSALQGLELRDEGIVLVMPRGPATVTDAPLAGVLVLRERGADGTLQTAFELSAPKVAAIPPGRPVEVLADAGIGFALALGFAFVGGLILNLMPCVFPVLAMKALALVRHGQGGGARAHGVAYLAGVLASFAVLAAVVLALQQGGARLGWGFQFQSPVFVVLIAWLLFGVGLNLSGVFEVGARLAGVGQSLAERPGHAGSFFTGVLAAVVATPCTAPFMGAAIGFAMSRPAPELVAIFLALGLGLAAPFVLLAWWPALQRWLPKPGAWMLRFRQFLAFPMYAAAVWLVWVLALQAGPTGVLVALGGMVALALVAWLVEVGRTAGGRVRAGCRLVAAGALVATLAAGAGIATNPPSDVSPEAASGGALLKWEGFTPDRFDALRAEGRPVFLNFTAAWCITCLVNEQVALERPEVARAFDEAGVAYLKGDWTNQDPAITEVLSRFGRSGVPLYLFYPAGLTAEPLVLPQILTPEIVLRTLAQHPSGD